MGEEYVSKLQQDVEMKLEYLCWAHNEPAFHVAEHFAGLRRQVDLDAEREIETAREEADEYAIVNVNDKRIEFIRILDELEKRIACQPKPEVGSNEIYSSLKQRVEAFTHSSSSLDDLEESYVQLAREIIDETDRVEKRIFGEQTIIYWPHDDGIKLGSLVYFDDMFLGRRDIDHLLSQVFSKEDARRPQISGNELLVPAREPRELNKNQQVLDSIPSCYVWFASASKFFYVGKTDPEFSGLGAEGSTIDMEFINYTRTYNETLQINGDVCLDTSENLFDACSYTNSKLEIENLRLESLHANLLPSPSSRLVHLILTGVHFESFDTTLLSQFTNLTELKIQATYSKDVKFDLKFLRPLMKLDSLELTLPGSSWDFSAFKRLIVLNYLKLESSSFYYAEKLPYLPKAALAQILSPMLLKKLVLCCFDIETIDRDLFNNNLLLNSLELNQSRISDSDQGADLNLGFPRLFNNPGKDFRRHSFHRHFSITLNHSGIRVLNAASFAGMKSLTELSLKGNLIADLPCGVFQDLISIRELELDKNRIKHISSGVFGQLNCLKILNLDGNPIESIEANAFAQLIFLNSLFLSGCRLKSIDSKMFNGLKSLKELRLNNNLIERIEVVSEDGHRINVAKANLSDEEKELILFKDLSRLPDLRLDGNKLEKFDLNCFRNLNFLFNLDMSSNKIIELSGVAEPELLSFLKRLYLDNNQLTAIDGSALPRSVERLNLAKNYLKQLDDDFFAKFKWLKSVNLSENKLNWTITEETFASCSDSLGRIDLSLNESIRVTEGATRDMPHLECIQCDFGEHFFSLPAPETLRISRLTPQVVRALKRFRRDQQDFIGQLMKCCLSGCSIRTLTRNPEWKNELDETQTDLGSFNLSWHPNAAKVRELVFSWNLIEKLDNPDLFSDFKYIKNINLSNNGLRLIHRDIFKCLYRLESIDLSGNSLYIIDTGLFRHLKRLEHLNLSSNNISFLNFARLFRICPDLKTLNIADNLLDDRSTTEPIDSRSSHHIRTLVLANNQLEKMDLVRDMTNLRHLDLRGNLIESVMSKEGENLLGRLRELTHLDMSDNKISTLTDEMFAHLHGQLEFLNISGNPLDSFQLDSVLGELI